MSIKGLGLLLVLSVYTIFYVNGCVSEHKSVKEQLSVAQQEVEELTITLTKERELNTKLKEVNTHLLLQYESLSKVESSYKTQLQEVEYERKATNSVIHLSDDVTRLLKSFQEGSSSNSTTTNNHLP